MSDSLTSLGKIKAIYQATRMAARSLFRLRRQDGSVHACHLYSARRANPSEVMLDVVFIHGLGGHPRETWSTHSSGADAAAFWPAWLEEDVDGARAIIVGYSSRLMPWEKNLDVTMRDRTSDLRNRLVAAGIGTRPWLIVAHSMGGILAKSLIKADHIASGTLINKLRSVRFIATPHRGAAAANLTVALGLGTSDTKLLRAAERENWTPLTELHVDYCQIRKHHKIESIGMYEVFETRGMLIVPQESAMADMDNVGDADATLMADHIECCKFRTREQDAYVRIRKWIAAHLDEARSKSDGAPSVLGDPLELAPMLSPPSRRFAVVAAVSLLFCIAALFFSPVGSSIRGHGIRQASIRFGAARLLPATAFYEGDRPKDFASVLIEGNPQLERLIECVEAKTTVDSSTCQGISMVVAPAGGGKSAIAKHLKLKLGTSAFLIDLSHQDFHSNERHRYAQIAGVLAASLPGVDGDMISKALSTAGNSRVLVVDSFDEIGPPARALVLELLHTWADGDPTRAAVVFSRKEAAADLFGESSTRAKDIQVVSLEPFRLEGDEAIIWAVGEYPCFRRNKTVALVPPFDKVDDGICSSWIKREKWVKERALALESAERYLLYTGELSNIIFEQRMVKDSGASYREILGALIARANRTHNRPGEGDDTFDAYGKALIQIAQCFTPGPQGVLNLEANLCDEGSPGVVSFESNGKPFKVVARDVLAYSGLVDPTLGWGSTPNALRFRFLPPALQVVLQCASITDKHLQVDDDCVRARLRGPTFTSWW